MTKPRYRIGSDGSGLRPITADLPAVRAPQSSFMRSEQSPFFFNWRPTLRDGRDDVRAAYVSAAGRAIDALHNSGWIAGAIAQATASTMGDGLRLALKPNIEALGWTKETGDGWARDVEREFEAWAGNALECDAGGKLKLGQIARAGLMSHFSHGETLALLPMVPRPWSQTRTKVKLLPPHKLVQDSDGERMFSGVTMGQWGLPLAYRIMMRIGQSYEEKIDIPARDGAARPQVVHIFDADFADQVRGITPMAPVLRVVRQYDQLADATLTSALIQAIFAATVQSDAPTSDVLNALQDDEEQGVGSGSIEGYLGAKADFYDGTKIDLGRGGKIAHLFPGEKLEFHGSETPNATYEAFAKFLLREIARCLGMTFETLTGDYTGATYSSVRMATSEIWPIVTARRNNIVAPLYQNTFDAWLEEAIEAGRITYPGGIYAFLVQRNNATRAEWRGPAKPQADDLKTQKAHEGYKRMGVMTDEQICAERGEDWEDVYEQRAREKALREKLGLPEGDTLNTAADEALVNSLITDSGKSDSKEAA